MRNFEGQQFINRMNFEASKHHRQILRSQIKPQLYRTLEVSDNPSANYMNAYKSVFKDELQKTMQEHYQKKAKEQNATIEEKMLYKMGPQYTQRNPSTLQHSASQPLMDQTSLMNNGSGYYGEQMSPKGKNFRDYYEQRTNKFENHIKQNYDGGQSFFKVQDQYQQKKMKEAQNYAQFLKKQLQEKEYSKMSQKQRERMEQMAAKEMQAYQQELDRQKYMQEYEQRKKEKMQKQNQVQQQRQRRHRRSQQFHYNNISLHNPITNPIEYHIDNPYILKKIQDKSHI